jgi:hypothetical protein
MLIPPPDREVVERQELAVALDACDDAAPVPP